MIQITNLYKTFGGFRVLDGLTLNIPEGRTTVIIGRSGVGKSVLLKNIVGLIRPDSGSIKLDGLELTDLPDKDYDRVRRDIGFVFQGGALFDSLNVEENVGFYLDEFMKLSVSQRKEKVAHALSLVKLAGAEAMMPAQLSGGMRKRVSLARALCMEPKIILYDEPTTGLDPVTADAINNTIIEMRDRLRVTSVVVTHDMTAAYKVADSIAMIYQGKVIADGSPDEIRNSRHPVVKQFIHGEAHGPIMEDERPKFGRLT